MIQVVNLKEIRSVLGVPESLIDCSHEGSQESSVEPRASEELMFLREGKVQMILEAARWVREDITSFSGGHHLILMCYRGGASSGQYLHFKEEQENEEHVQSRV